jgi:hypothetical protein
VEISQRNCTGEIFRRVGIVWGVFLWEMGYFLQKKFSVGEFFMGEYFCWEGEISRKNFPWRGDFGNDLKNNHILI